ncbi:MAG TPA: SDR family oxidoreductase [Frankiaceae bacterium]|jgi:3-oxoacyl-[acyl-carrier protein] reductase|nr:SDR family oxidoreductase [Frankiaceae bacterium]
MPSLESRRIVLTGASPAAVAIADALTAAGGRVQRIADGFGSESAVAAALSGAETALGGIDQIVHAWVPEPVMTAAPFMSLDEQAWAGGCEAALSGAWWLARQAIPLLLKGGGSLVFLVPTIGMSGAAEYSMLASVAEGIRVLAKGCGRQLGTEGVTVNTIATANALWMPPDDAKTVTGATTLSTPAFGRSGDPGADLAPLVALIGQAEAHFVTAGTVVADGGIWMGL